VPPRDTASVPIVIFVASRDVSPEPLPLNDLAVTASGKEEFPAPSNRVSDRTIVPIVGLPLYCLTYIGSDPLSPVEISMNPASTAVPPPPTNQKSVTFCPSMPLFVVLASPKTKLPVPDEISGGTVNVFTPPIVWFPAVITKVALPPASGIEYVLAAFVVYARVALFACVPTTKFWERTEEPAFIVPLTSNG
jgi:hypothetical protein